MIMGPVLPEDKIMLIVSSLSHRVSKCMRKQLTEGKENKNLIKQITDTLDRKS